MIVVLILLSHGESHLAWYKNVIVLVASVGAFYVCVRIWTLFNRLILILLRVLAAIVGHISPVWSHVVTLLVVRVKVLDVEGSSSLVAAEGGVGAWLKGLVLPSRSSRGVKMLSDVSIWRLENV